MNRILHQKGSSVNTHIANILGRRIMTKIYCFYMVNLKICTLNLFFTGVMPSLLCHLESYVKEINSLDIVLGSEISLIGY